MVRFMAFSDFKEWPPGISDGLASVCQICEQKPKFDFQIDGETWRLIVPEHMRAGVICLSCLDLEAQGRGIDVLQHLREVQFSGCQSTVVLVPALVVSKE